MVISLPALIFLNSWQVFRYEVVAVEVGRMQEQQKAWVEASKELIVGIEFLSSPERIGRLAEEDLELEKIEYDEILRVEIQGGR